MSNNSNLWDGRASLYVDDGTSSYDAYINSSDGGSTFGDCFQDVNVSDITIECADQIVNGLTLHPEVYYFADHNLTRVIWVKGTIKLLVGVPKWMKTARCALDY